MATAATTGAFLLFVLQAFFSVLLLFPAASHAQVPASETFREVNEGDFGDYGTEYGASYRLMDLFGSPYQLMWYNTTPGQYYVGLRMGIASQETNLRWVWEANRGRPVGENATLTFGTDGNLVLAEADGTVVWQTGTANKGVVGIKIVPIQGNIVLYDKHGRYVWQSFDHPTDTLLPGQSLYVGGPTQLVSRRSESDTSDGIYRLTLDTNGLNLYLDAPNSKRLRYSNGRFTTASTPVTKVTLRVKREGKKDYVVQLAINDAASAFDLARTNYNASTSMLRLTTDGNLEAYAYRDDVESGHWPRNYIFFDKRGTLPSCSLPSKCGPLGLCEKERCVACPTKGGLLKRTSCEPPKLEGCTSKTNGAAGVDYYKVAGVEHFIPNYNKEDGKMTMDACRRKCTADCSCLGFFYWKNNSTCWLAPVLGSLTRGSDPSHEAYIKYLK